MTEEGDKVDCVHVDGYMVVHGLVENPLITACQEQYQEQYHMEKLSPQCEELIKKARADMKRIDPKELIKRLTKDEYNETDYDHVLKREVAQEVHPKLQHNYYTIKDYGCPDCQACPLNAVGQKGTVLIRAYTTDFEVFVYVLCTELICSPEYIRKQTDNLRGLIDG